MNFIIKFNVPHTLRHVFTIKVLIVIIISIIFSIPDNIVFSQETIENRLDDIEKMVREEDYKNAYIQLLEVVKNLKEELDNANEVSKFYKEKTSGRKNEYVPADLSLQKAAQSLWTSAWRKQHDGIFRKTGKEKEKCLNEAVGLYKRIYIDYPNTDKASEAQYRVGRIYYKFLKDYENAEIALDRYMNMYPNGKYASDANTMLRKIRKE